MHQDVHEHSNEFQHHVTPLGTLLLNYVGLLVLLAITIGIAFVPLGPLNNVVALTIAVVKAILVVLFFMGVYWGTRLTWLWVIAGFVWMLLLFGTFGDYLTRGWLRVPGW